MFKLRSARLRGSAVLAASLAGAGACLLAGEEKPLPPAGPQASTPFHLPGVDAGLLAPFQRARSEVVVAGQRRGFVDWSGKTLVAVGRSVQAGPGAAPALQARRAAEVIALRNVLAASLGVRIGINGRIEGLKNGRLFLKGHLKDFKVTRTYQRKQAGKTFWFAEVRVPMFGVKALAGRLYDEQLRTHRRLLGGRKRARWVAPAGGAHVGGDLIVIDARGLAFDPCMYPCVVTEDERVLLDMETVPRPVAVGRGCCSYATTELEFERLQSRRPPAGLGERERARESVRRPEPAAGCPWALAMPSQDTDGVGWGTLVLARADAPKAPAAATAPATRPRRKPRRHPVRALRAGGKNKAVLVISNKEALKLLKSPRAAGLARNGRVLVVVDAAGAGMEGRRPPRPEAPVAIARRRR